MRCHYSTAGATYSYGDPARNIIASADTFKQRIVGHPFKYESHRLGLERSEDALSWNVFRSLEEADLLRKLASLIVGEDIPYHPFLFLWGIQTTDDQFEPWDLLVEARRRFESNLPVDRPLTEPDIALFLPGRYLILIEAKFTSKNTFYGRGPRANQSSLTLDELIDIYQSPELESLNIEKARARQRVHYQLWRNMVFSEWMAKNDHPQTNAFHVNLVREGYDEDSTLEFGSLLNPRCEHRFQRLTWEQIYRHVQHEDRVERLLEYMRTKTAGLQPAFSLQ